MKLSACFRSLAFELFLWLSVVVYSLTLLVLAPVLPRQRLFSISRHWNRLVLWVLRRLCGLDYQARGLEHLHQSAGQVVVSNHQSAWETIALGYLVPPPTTWVMKRELLRIPFFGSALKLFKPIAIDRADGRAAMRLLLQAGVQRIAEGHRVLIFPEGTRVAPGLHRRFGLGGALLASRTGAVIVPIAHNAGVFWPHKGLCKRPGQIELVVGEPIETAGKTAAEINRQVEQWIRATLATLPAQPQDRA